MSTPLLDAFHKGYRSFLFIGDTDTGKTTLCRRSAEVFLGFVDRVAIVDADIGQSSLFLPGTVSVKILRRPEELRTKEVDFIYFVGLWNPALSMQVHLKATKRAVMYARRRASLVLIDSTGLVRGPLGRKLKIEKVHLVRPDIVVAIQKDRELEDILQEIPSDKTLLLSPEKGVRIRSRQERISYRRNLYRDYFNNLYLHYIPMERVSFLYPFTPRHQRGLLCGLVAGGRVKALGVVDDFLSSGIEVLSPWPEKDVERCLLGGVFLDEEVYLL